MLNKTKIATNAVTDMESGPIFIGGFKRSGKTYIRLMLSSHPNIALTRRTNFWSHYFKKFGDLSQGENLELCLQAMLENKHIDSLKPDPERIRREFFQGPATYARLFAIIQEQYAGQEGKLRWGDQMELMERYADQVFAAFPTAKMIHMIRDPRDLFEASLTRRTRRKGGVGATTAGWLYSVAMAKRNQEKYLGRYKVIQYEEMVSNAEETIREVCTFLNEEFVPSMLTMEAVPRFQRKISVNIKSENSPLSTDFIGRYRQGLSQSEVAFIQKYAGGDMLAYRYSLERIQFPNHEYIKYYFLNWPVYRGMMTSWYMRKSLQDRYPEGRAHQSTFNRKIRSRAGGESESGTI